MNNIGFGCVNLTHNFSEKQALRNLETAYDNGILHYDVARMYGFGLAEGIVGKFARNKRSKITITTKVGITPESFLLRNLFFQNTTRIIYNLLRKSSNSNVKATNGLVNKNFNISKLRKSLEKSLKELNIDHIDYLLLHEATVLEANNHDLVYFLENEKNKGTIRSYGIGSYFLNIETNLNNLAQEYTILQTDNSFPQKFPSIVFKKRFDKYFFFSPFRYINPIKTILDKNPALSKKICMELDLDIKYLLIDLFLIHQQYTNTDATFLFSSNKNKHIKMISERWGYISSLGIKKFNNFGLILDMLNKELSTYKL